MALGSGIDTYILKTVEWCNLDCTYCYYYHGADDSFLRRPRYLALDMIREAVPKIIAHSKRHGIDRIDVTLHGGEPLLQPQEECLELMQILDGIDAAGISTRRKVTTNGVLFDENWARLFSQWNTLVGFSIDGPEHVHDAARVDHAGRGSYRRVIRGLEAALPWHRRGLLVGTLSVINPAISGVEAYQHLRELGVDMMNFLLPESNYASPPPDIGHERAPYGRFLSEVFDAWVAEDNDTVEIRILSEAVKGLATGGESDSDQFGDAPVRVAVLETDGSIEPTDNLKACENGLTNLGLNIYNHDFDDLYYHPVFAKSLDDSAAKPPECHTCRYLATCGAGRLTHRYSREEGFARKTIYCEDMLQLFDHVDEALHHYGLV